MGYRFTVKDRRRAEIRHERLLSQLSRRGLLGFSAGVAVGGLFSGTPVEAREEHQPHSLETFFGPEVVVAAALSPAGDRVAVLRNIGETGRR